MLPASFQTPAAIILLLGGLLSCFAGYRVFRVVLGFFGFVLGALLASSLMGTEQTMYMIVAALVGGIIGSLILVGAYFVGVALIGAGVGALIVNVDLGRARPRAAHRHRHPVRDRRRARRAGAAALRHHRGHRLRRRLDDDRRRAGAGGRSLGDRRGGAQQCLAGVSDEPRARSAMGDRRVAPARPGWCGRAVDADGERQKKK